MANRTSNSIRNAKYSLIGETLNVFLGFLSRKIFVSILAIEYLGLSGLFSNILTLLSITELGIGSAFICLLYKPLADDKKEKIASIMSVYKKIYTIIGCVVGIVGVSLTPILPFLIKEMPDISYISFIYILYVFNSAISYFFSYKRELIIANQQRYIYSMYNIVIKTAMYIGQIIVLVLTRNYILFLLVIIVATLTENILISRKADKLFPYIRTLKPQKMSKDEINEVKEKVVGSSFHKIGDMLIIGTTNILISKIVGLVVTGLYSNYILIISVINTVMTLIYNSILASAGNLGAQSGTTERKNIFNKIFFFTAWAFGFSACCFLGLLNPFIRIWLGEEFLLSNSVVIIIVINFYLIGMRRPIAMMRDALGIFTHDKFKVIPEIIINFTVSIIAGIKFGVFGIILGNIVSNLCTTFWTYPYVLYHYGFDSSVKEYYKKYSGYSLLILIACFVCWFLCNFIPDINIITFALKMLICFVLPNIWFFMAFHKSDEFKFFVGLIKDRMKRGTKFL